MSDLSIVISLLITGLLAGVVGWFLASIRSQTKIVQLETILNLQTESTDNRDQTLKKTFTTLAGDALKDSNRSFLQLAQETLKQFHIQAKGELDQREKAVENLVKPIHEALKKTEDQIREIEKERKQAYGSLNKHLENMSHTQQQLQDETRNLVKALRRPEVRGQWGELTLKRLVELAGMVEHCDFYEQENINTDEGRQRPDMIVRMPGKREIVVDAKTPLDAYLNAIEANQDDARVKYLEQHARNVRERVRELASKKYWEQLSSTPDFVVLFIPGDQFLSTALDIDRDLLENALQQRVILATPTSLVALLRAIAYGWRQEQLAENADEIRVAGEDLYKRLAVFSEHLAKVGRSLDGAVGNFNKAVGSFDSKVMTGAKKLADMGIGNNKEIAEPEQIEKAARQIEDRKGSLH
jgi:DNA recombination protein RmuC